MFDVCAPGLFIGQAIGRYGNFFNAEVYGRETASFLGMTINGGAPVHPLFFYESTWNLIGLLLILLLRDKKKNDGQVFMGYLFWYSAGRLILEGMRQSQYILYAIPGVLGISQLVAAAAICISVIGFVSLQISDKKSLPQTAAKSETISENDPAEHSVSNQTGMIPEETASKENSEESDSTGTSDVCGDDKPPETL